MPPKPTRTQRSKATAKRRMNKKPRQETQETDNPPQPKENPIPPQCYLAQVPLEILAEILSYTSSPRDILALARCSQYFCHTLVQPSSTFIWKHARARCLPTPIPDPLPNFTEASYASFIFDGGECEVCKEKTSRHLVSFTIRLRLCAKTSCRNSWREKHSMQIDPVTVKRYLPILTWLPPLENRDFTQRTLVALHMFRLSDWNAAADEYNKASLNEATMAQYNKDKEVLMKRLPIIFGHGLALTKWKREREQGMSQMEAARKTRIREIATTNGWDEWNLIQSPAFNALVRARYQCLEPLTDKDIEPIRHTLEPQIIEMGDRTKRQLKEQNLLKSREAIEAVYNRLRSIHSDKAFPALSEFRKLPTAELVQKGTVPITSQDLQKEPIHGMFVQDLEQWRGKAREAMGAMLGFPEWKNASKLKLHPVERLTARFKCKSCGNKEGREADWNGYGLDFKGACAHRCGHLSSKRQNKVVFKPENFEPDQKAVHAIQQILSQLDLQADDAKTLRCVIQNEPDILCHSCPKPIMMTYEEMLRHCKRHDEPVFEILKDLRVYQQHALQNPYSRGLRKRLLEPQQKSRRDLKIYGCRHCLLDWKSDAQTSESSIPALAVVVDDAEPSLQPPPEPSADSVPQAIPTEALGEPSSKSEETKPRNKRKIDNKSHKKTRKPVVFTFDGLRSHVKEKHGIIWVGDEDVFVDDSLVSSPAVKPSSPESAESENERMSMRCSF